MFRFAVVLLAISGFSVARPGPKIHGGDFLDIEDVPYQLYLSVYCGASIISEEWAMTAAHCVKEDGKYFVRAGSENREAGGTKYNISNVYIHPLRPTEKFDIALLKIDGIVEFTDKVQPVKLPEVGFETEADSLSLVSGWGKTEQQEYPELLKGVYVPMYSRERCNKVLSDPVNGFRWVCAGSKGKSGCFGDSGGPLVQNGVQIGIVSFGWECGLEKKPTVYSRIAHPGIRNWITEMTGL